MKFLNLSKKRPDKIILVISDVHIGAGPYIESRFNYLEDFHYDDVFSEFLIHYISPEYQGIAVELVINGDFLDFLAVPFVRYFDDEFWSEAASLEKMEIIYEAHPKVFEAIRKFLENAQSKLIYIIGNHDAEFIFPSMQEKFIHFFPEEVREKIHFIQEDEGEYSPLKGILIKHGHEYEFANDFKKSQSIITDELGKKYFLPPWGSYLVTRVVNKLKEERSYINQVRPMKIYLINGLIYDTLFAIRFMMSLVYYFVMVRFITIFKVRASFKDLFAIVRKELTVFQNYDTLAQKFFRANPDIKVLITGHTHNPIFRTFSNGPIFINTGTWMRMNHLDFESRRTGENFIFAKIAVYQEKVGEKSQENFDVGLFVWKGPRDLPYELF